MSTLDDAPPGSLSISSPSAPVDTTPEYGDDVHALLTAAAESPLVRTQRLGIKAQEALDALSGALKKEKRLAELADEMARLRRGED